MPPQPPQQLGHSPSKFTLVMYNLLATQNKQATQAPRDTSRPLAKYLGAGVHPKYDISQSISKSITLPYTNTKNTY